MTRAIHTLRRQREVLCITLVTGVLTIGTPASGQEVTRQVTATRALKAPVINGRDDDAVWQALTPTRGFRQYDPGEDAPPEFQTEYRVAYDDRFFYVLVRAFDPHPDSIVRLLSRRDVKTNSDQLGIIIDGFHDRRNAAQFWANPAGVKRDGVFFNDVTEDMSWDGVWDVGVHTDQLGWAAEFRVPFSQLRFATSDTLTFGLSVVREISRLNQKDSWPMYRRSVKSVVGQLGTVSGIRGVPAARRLEILPYTVTKSVPATTAGRPNVTQLAAGLDVKAGLGSNLTLDATVNPDFGQVEADPAILNLTAFETRFDERRLFFQEGLGRFRCGMVCDGPFYTRRIGRAPQLRSSAGDKAYTSILGAAKVTGKFSNGVTLAVLDAVTQEERGSSGGVIEPQTNYFVMRTALESDDGSRQAGVLVTDTRRRLNAATAPLLRGAATIALLQASTRFAHDRFEISGFKSQSFVSGSAAAIALTQRNSVHYFQRPGNEMGFDSTRTSLTGGAMGGSIKKLRGAVRYETFLRHSTPGQEMNDLGLVPTVNDMSIRQSLDYQPINPGRWFRSAFTHISAESRWTTGGLPTGRSFSIHSSASLYNNWSGALTYNGSDFGGINCVSCARGGPALRQSPSHTLRLDVSGDARRTFVPTSTWNVGISDEGRSSFNEINGGISVRAASRFSVSLAAAYNRSANDQQWVRNYGHFLSDTTHYTYARLDQTTLALVGRANWTATPTLSLQLYAQPFISAGAYSMWRELAVPRAEPYAARFRSYSTNTPSGFNVKQFNSNAVVRWEYRPGSVLFVVWQQGRFEDTLNRGTFDGRRDVGDLLTTPPQNTVLVKLSYWFSL